MNNRTRNVQCVNKVQRLLPKKAGIYVGQTKNNRPYGNGIGSWWGDNMYPREWDNSPDAKTKWRIAGKRQEGYFLGGLRHGTLSKRWRSGKKYEENGIMGFWKGNNDVAVWNKVRRRMESWETEWKRNIDVCEWTKVQKGISKMDCAMEKELNTFGSTEF